MMVDATSPDERCATLADVALALGVSTATVSRALNKPQLLNPKTVERIQRAAEEMRYRPNYMAKHLKSGRTHNILVVMPRLSPFFLEMFRGIEEAANHLGYFAIIAHGGRDPLREGEYFDQVSAGRADGVLLLSSGTGPLPRPNKYGRPPVVSLLDADFTPGIPSVRIDHRLAAHAATTHLIALGHRHIAHISGCPDSPMTFSRRAGFLQAMADAALTVGPGQIVDGGFTLEAGESAMALLLQQAPRPSAVFAANDEAAIGAIKAIKNAGLNVPADISVIGFDDQRLARIYDPGLTTVHVPAFELGYRGLGMLNDLLRGMALPDDQILETHVVQRATTAQPSA